MPSFSFCSFFLGAWGLSCSLASFRLRVWTSLPSPKCLFQPSAGTRAHGTGCWAFPKNQPTSTAALHGGSSLEKQWAAALRQQLAATRVARQDREQGRLRASEAVKQFAAKDQTLWNRLELQRVGSWTAVPHTCPCLVLTTRATEAVLKEAENSGGQLLLRRTGSGLAQ